MHLRLASAISNVILVLAFGCGDSGSGFDGEHSAYGPVTPTTTTVSRIFYGSVHGKALSQELGEITVNGASYTRLATTTPESPEDGVEFWVHRDGDVVTLGGIDLHSVAASLIVPPAVLTLDAPLTVSLTPPIGQVQTKTASGTVMVVNDPQPHQVDGTGQYTLVETNVPVTTNAGTLEGTSHFTGTITVNGDLVPEAFRGKPLAGDLWYHPSFRVVALDVPELGYSSRMVNSADCGTPDGDNHRLIRKVEIIDGDNPRFLLDTYVCAGNEFDADKDTHSKMLLELRWFHEDMARSDVPPGDPAAHIEFGTVWGTYPYTLVRSPVSVMHPEENGKGFVYWIAYVDQAAKNESMNGIAYHIQVQPDSVTRPIRASARIFYKRYP